MRLSTKLSRIEYAITSKLKLRIKYHNVVRDVEPHILGYNFEKKPVMRVYELLRDGVRTNDFKTYLLSDIQSITVTSKRFSRTVTKSTDEAMSKIVLTTYNGKKEEKE